MDIHDILGVPTGTYATALDALATGDATLVVIGGKMTAGKDTVAPILRDHLGPDTAYLRYGDMMRQDLTPGLNILKDAYAGTSIDTFTEVHATRAASVTAAVATAMTLPRTHAAQLVDILAPEVVTDPLLTPLSRTAGIRTVLQNLGDSWRCTTPDDPYWAAKVTRAALEELTAGHDVVVTGGRYIPDVAIPARINGIVIRLDVTRETQVARLTERDGLAPTPEVLTALDHPGETSLDDYPFEVRVDNNTNLDATIAEVLAAVDTARAARRA